MHEESLIVIKPGSQRVVYDGRFVATLINDLNAQTGTYDDAEKWALAGQYSTYFTGTISSSKFFTWISVKFQGFHDHSSKIDEKFSE